MKAKIILTTILSLGILSFANNAQALEKITVAATPVPHAEILEVVKPILEKEGFDLQVTEFNDYTLPQLAVHNHDVDANFYQHAPGLKAWVSEHHHDLIEVPNSAVHIEPMGVYSKKIKDLKDLKDGALIAIPNDLSNCARALILLSKAGLIKLDDPNNVVATELDIVENPKNLQFRQLDAAQLPRSLEDTDASIINANYAIEAGLNPLKDSLFVEEKESPYVNILVAHSGSIDKPGIKALAKALHSPEVKKFIEEKYQGAVAPAF
ncbi:MAG: MetQ/NlpA family ABC transporter substrate-binding protein [Succinatimonas sp.]|nr:MetQ/NlpA family ABC transporter substrate-binding protein [Succinatimonas sp.]